MILERMPGTDMGIVSIEGHLKASGELLFKSLPDDVLELELITELGFKHIGFDFVFLIPRVPGFGG